MPDIFISYSVKDEKLAQFVKDHCEKQSLRVFLSSISLNEGIHWTPQVKAAHRNSKWVFFLASKAALDSQSVQMEIGGAVFSTKFLVPIMWDVEPEELPRWVSDYQGIQLKGASIENINQKMTQLASAVKAKKANGNLVVGAVVLGLLYLFAK